ncbi:MAG: hypothetical protein KatS3mg076_0418 [Candidatus Binatia bacterium]|nr:MAG: hypothetical protein KatS3mg076_0418 [Candidatus Binatia bacterium]
MEAVYLPVLGANMTHATVRRWYKQEGETVAPGDLLVEVETDKVNVDIEAETGGVLRKIVAPEGRRVPVLSILAFVGEKDEPVPPPDAWPKKALPEEICGEPAVTGRAERGTPGRRSLGPEPDRYPASPAARRLARELGVSLEGLRGSGPRGEITREDVLRARGAGELDPGFLDLLRRYPERFRDLPSEAKVELYRRHGAAIGEGVRIEQGTLVLAREIRIGGGTVLGPESHFECEKLELGRLVAFGRGTKLECREARVGDALWSKDRVTIGGGGRNEPEARLEIGDACFLGDGAYLNPGLPIRLGDEVCIGAGAMLFTHSHWQSILRGYASVFAPIEIGDHVFVGNNAFVFPGVRIGSGATVLVQSFVALDVPERVLVGGVPARVIREIRPLTREERIAEFSRRLPELVRRLERLGWPVAQERTGQGTWMRLGPNAAVGFFPDSVPRIENDGRVVLLVFGAATPEGCTVFDLEAGRVVGPQDELSDEVREFCRRLGIRFRPFAWRYRVGHFEGDRFVRREFSGSGPKAR